MGQSCVVRPYFFVTLLVTGMTYFSLQEKQSIQPEFHYQSLADRPSLDAFLETLDSEVMQECVARHDAGRSIDLDYLATCGDFEMYAKYMGISKYEAVKKFAYVLSYSSSRLEFEARLALLTPNVMPHLGRGELLETRSVVEQ